MNKTPDKIETQLQTADLCLQASAKFLRVALVWLCASALSILSSAAFRMGFMRAGFVILVLVAVLFVVGMIMGFRAHQFAKRIPKID